MALTVGELVAKLNRLNPNAYPIAYRTESDMGEFSVDGVATLSIHSMNNILFPACDSTEFEPEDDE